MLSDQLDFLQIFEYNASIFRQKINKQLTILQNVTARARLPNGI